MPNKRKSMKQIKEMIRLHEQGDLGERGIARALKMSRTSVRKYLLKAKQLGLTLEDIKDMNNEQVEQLLYPTEKSLGKYEILIEYFPTFTKRLKERGMTLQILWEEYKEEHPDGLMYSRLCYYYQRWRKSLDVSMHQEHKAGDKMFVDFTGEHLKMIDPITGAEKEVEVFVAILGASQLTYVEAAESQKKHDWIKCNQNALLYFGGVPCAIVPDNLKSGVTMACKYDPDINPEYLDFAVHFKTTILPARPGHSRDKALAENMVGIVYTRIFVPLRKQVFYSLEDMNEAIRIELEKHNNKKFQKLPYSRRELFNDIEKHLLKPLPAERFVIKKYAHPKVQFNYHVELREDVHYYSVPHKYAGKKTTMIYTDTIVEIYIKNTRIAMHQRNRTLNGYTTLPEHMPPKHRFMAEWTPERMIRWGEKIGEYVREMTVKLFQSREHPEQAFKVCMGLLNLTKKYPGKRVNNACKRAINFNCYTLKAIRNILEKNFDKVEEDILFDKPLPSHNNLRGSGYYGERKITD